MKSKKIKFNGLLGGFGSVFAGLCCAGAPSILALLSALGLGFLVNDLILFPLLFLFLGVMFYSLRKNYLNHKNKYPIYISVLSTLLLLIGIFKGWIIWIGVFGLIIAPVYDIILLNNKNCKKC